MTKTRLALLAALLLGLAAASPAADAYSCTSYRSGDYVYTNCY